MVGRLVEILVELLVELLQSFCRAFVELYIEFRVEHYIGMQTFLWAINLDVCRGDPMSNCMGVRTGNRATFVEPFMEPFLETIVRQLIV